MTRKAATRKPPTKDIQMIYCRKCMQMKKDSEFYSAVDKLLDTNGLMSVCKQCCDDIFQANYIQTNDMQLSLLNTCRSLNVAFSDVSLLATINYIEKSDKSVGVFGIYKKFLSNPNAKNGVGKVLTFVEPLAPTIINNPIDENDENADVEDFWGKGLNYEDYSFLEKELSEWKQTHKCDNKAELTLLKEIVYKQWEIKKAREQNKSTDGIVKSLQDLMKTASVDPAKSNLANSGKNLDAFGLWIKDIERTTPAEWLDERGNAFDDVDNMDKYCEDYIKRPIKNFLSGSRDFNIGEESEDDDLADFYDDGDGGQ